MSSYHYTGNTTDSSVDSSSVAVNDLRLNLLGIEPVNATAVRVSWSEGDRSLATDIHYECVFTDTELVVTHQHTSVPPGDSSILLLLCQEDMGSGYQHRVTLVQTAPDSETQVSVKETFSLGSLSPIIMGCPPVVLLWLVR